MAPTTDGFDWAGLVRSLQGDLTSFVGFVILVILCLAAARRLLKGLRDKRRAAPDARMALRAANGLAALLVAAGAALFLWRAASVSATNRVPRADIDKASVYQQMDALKR
jgi:hypothetical protein